MVAEGYQGDEGILSSAGVISLIGLFGALTVDIWSTVDAVRVAKINNMAWRANYKQGMGLQISPDLRVLPGQRIVPVMTLAYKF